MKGTKLLKSFVGNETKTISQMYIRKYFKWHNMLQNKNTNPLNVAT